MLAQLLPCGLNSRGSHPVSNIQASVFECGGIAIGLCISHRILDGTALSFFLKAWANDARSLQENVKLGTTYDSSQEKPDFTPDLSAFSLFPSNDLWLQNTSMAMWGALFKTGKFVTKRFVFDGSAIASLKDMAMGGTNNKNDCTRVEAVSGFIWKHAAAASKERFGSAKPSLLAHVVNLRPRASPNFSEKTLGNLIWIASAKCYNNVQEDKNLEHYVLVDEIRRSIEKIDDDYVKKLSGDEGSSVMNKYMKEIQEFVCGDNVDFLGSLAGARRGFMMLILGGGGLFGLVVLIQLVLHFL